jgi:pimeloyl-ACP methyl ester carboxylesterase
VVSRRRQVQLPTHVAEVLEWGAPDGRLVVALHGFPDTAWTWRRVAPLLADAGLRVAAPFLRGYAPSGIPSDGDYSVRALADDAVALHAALRGGPDAVLLGHDWGAITTNAVVADPASPYGKHVSLAVPPFTAMSPSRDTVGAWAAAMARQPFHSWYIAVNQVPGLSERHLDRLAARLWRSWSPGYDPHEDLELLRAAVPDLEHARAVVSYYRAMLGRGITPALAEPAAPLLYLHGDRDGALDPRFFPVVERWVPDGSRAALIGGAGHFLQLERPAEVATEILAFVS